MWNRGIKDEQIKEFTCQRELPLAMASGRVEFSSPELNKEMSSLI